LKIVTLDEADEMLRMGFQEDVEWILAHARRAANALFSATMPRQIRRIAEKYLKDAGQRRNRAQNADRSDIKQFYVNVSESAKTDALTDFWKPNQLRAKRF
jgi:ATP-dependent RNA helicase DeaD